MPDLTGKVAIVTGASRGIGAAVARRLAAAGASVVVNYSGSADAAAAVVDDIVKGGGIATASQADVSDSEACQRLVDSAVENYGSLDILVNNAGIARDGLLVRMSDEDWKAVIDINLSGVFYMSRAAGKVMMKQRSGSIVNITSVIGLVGNAGQANYAAAKAGVIGLSKSIARELASRNVRVNAVAPGFIETDMTSGLSEQVCEAARSQIAMAKFGSPDDVAAAVEFFAGDSAAYVTGQVLAVDGGMTFV